MAQVVSSAPNAGGGGGGGHHQWRFHNAAKSNLKKQVLHSKPFIDAHIYEACALSKTRAALAPRDLIEYHRCRVVLDDIAIHFIRLCDVRRTGDDATSSVEITLRSSNDFYRHLVQRVDEAFAAYPEWIDTYVIVSDKSSFMVPEKRRLQEERDAQLARTCANYQLDGFQWTPAADGNHAPIVVPGSDEPLPPLMTLRENRPAYRHAISELLEWFCNTYQPPPGKRVIVDWQYAHYTHLLKSTPSKSIVPAIVLANDDESIEFAAAHDRECDERHLNAAEREVAVANALRQHPHLFALAPVLLETRAADQRAFYPRHALWLANACGEADAGCFFYASALSRGYVHAAHPYSWTNAGETSGVLKPWYAQLGLDSDDEMRLYYANHMEHMAAAEPTTPTSAPDYPSVYSNLVIDAMLSPVTSNDDDDESTPGIIVRSLDIDFVSFGLMERLLRRCHVGASTHLPALLLAMGTISRKSAETAALGSELLARCENVGDVTLVRAESTDVTHQIMEQTARNGLFCTRSELGAIRVHETIDLTVLHDIILRHYHGNVVVDVDDDDAEAAVYTAMWTSTLDFVLTALCGGNDYVPNFTGVTHRRLFDAVDKMRSRPLAQVKFAPDSYVQPRIKFGYAQFLQMAKAFYLESLAVRGGSGSRGSAGVAISAAAASDWTWDEVRDLVKARNAKRVNYHAPSEEEMLDRYERVAWAMNYLITGAMGAQHVRRLNEMH